MENVYMYDAQVYIEKTCLKQDKSVVENKPSGGVSRLWI